MSSESTIVIKMADRYSDAAKSMAARTNYGYDEILGYSKLLLNSYAPEETFGLLTTLSDATAGLNLSSSDVEMFIKGFSRMRTTGKVTQEYLNYFSERGVDVYEALLERIMLRGRAATSGEWSWRFFYPNILVFGGRSCFGLGWFVEHEKTPASFGTQGLSLLVEEGGFEPPKRNATDLQSAPFGHSGTPPY